MRQIPRRARLVVEAVPVITSGVVVGIHDGDAPLDAAHGHWHRRLAGAARGGERGGRAGSDPAARAAVRPLLGLVLALQQQLAKLREDLGEVVQGLEVSFGQRLGVDVREVHLEDIGRDGAKHDLKV